MRPETPTGPRPRMARGQRELLLRHALRDPALFALARREVRGDHLNRDGDYPLALLWHACLRVSDRHYRGELPPDPVSLWALAESEVEALAEAGEVALPPTVAAQLSGPGGLFERLLGPGPAPERHVGDRLLVDFLRERTVLDPLCDMVQSLGGHVPEDLDGELTRLQDRDRTLQSMGRSTARSAAPAGYAPPDLDKMSTGVDFLDDIMGGGDAPREVYAVMGAYGSGKTLLAVQACYQKALLFQARAEQLHPLEHCHLFHYEAGYGEVLRRLWSHAAQIHQASLESLSKPTLSSRGALKPYELELFADEVRRHGAQNVDGEAERLERAKSLLSRNVYLHDFSGNDPDNPGAGCGYVEEIAASLRHEAQQGRKVGAVYIDYVLLACRNHLRKAGKREEHLRHLVGEFPMACLRQIAAPFDCRVYLFHQLSAAANGRSFLSRFSSVDAAEGRNLPENVWFALCLSPKDQETSCVRVHCDKSRRSPGVSSPLLVRVLGHLGTMQRATDMVIDPTLGRPVPKVDMDAVAQSLDLAEVVRPGNPAPIDLADSV